MANFSQVNKAVKKAFPQLDVEVVRGAGYVYFSGDDSDGLDSIMTHPTSTTTADMIDMIIESIDWVFQGK